MKVTNKSRRSKNVEDKRGEQFGGKQRGQADSRNVIQANINHKRTKVGGEMARWRGSGKGRRKVSTSIWGGKYAVIPPTKKREL